MNSSRIFASSFALLLSGIIAAEAAGFTAGNLVVVRVGDGSAALSSAASPVFLQEYTPAGALVQIIAMPTNASGANNIFTTSGTGVSEGFLKLSVDGEHLTLAGYAAAPGTAGVSGTTSSSVSRVVAVINSNGVVDTSTALTDACSGASIRSAVSSDGTQVWVGGTSSSATGAGVRYALVGHNTSTQLVGQSINPPNNVRCVAIFGGQLYVSAASGTFESVATVGTGLPTSQVAATQLPGVPTSSGPSPYDYCLLDLAPDVPGPDTLYIADDRTGVQGGIQKWTSDGTSWTLKYVMLNTPCRGLTATLAPDGTNVILYATTGNTLISVTDTGLSSVATTVATAPANTVFRGVAFAPPSAAVVQPVSLAVAPSGGNVVVSWPSPSTGWTLQFNQDLTTTNWSNSSATINDDGTNKSVLVTPVGKQFYRLSH